jgi:cell division protein FtsI/penicillin-binding protein 2
MRTSEIEVISKQVKRNLEQRNQISLNVSNSIKNGQFPSEMTFDWFDRKDKFKVTYTLDERLQEEADSLFKRYRPDYGAVVLMDAMTGKVLALSSYQKMIPKLLTSLYGLPTRRPHYLRSSQLQPLLKKPEYRHITRFTSTVPTILFIRKT